MYGAVLHGRLQRLGAAPGGIELLLWSVLLLLAVLLRAHFAGGPELANDSYQYLSAAEHLRSGEAATSLVHFDAERSHGRIPAPLTTFPPGYPLLMALLAATGLDVEQAGILISLAATVALAALLGQAAGLLGAPAATTRVLLLVLMASSALLLPGNQVASEALFTALSLGALLLLLAAEARARADRGHLALQLGANALIAAACSVRYAGLFLFAAVALFHAGRWLAGRRPRARQALAAMALSALPIGLLLWRNHVLVGSWQGGNIQAFDNPLPEVLYRFAQSMHHLLLGDAPARFGAPEAGLALALGLFAAAALPALWRARSRWLADPRLRLIGLYLAVYVGAMIYLGARSPISFGPRMFVPLLPVLLLLAGALWRHAGPPRSHAVHGAAAALLVVSYAAVNLQFIVADPGIAPHERVRARLDARIESLLPADATLAATDGQATGYVLRRKTLSLATPRFSVQAWTEDAVRSAMRRFGARHLLVYREAAPSAFLAALATGSPPQWLQLVADNGEARLFVRLEPG
jgi:hypothetical protein